MELDALVAGVVVNDATRGREIRSGIERARVGRNFGHGKGSNGHIRPHLVEIAAEIKRGEGVGRQVVYGDGLAAVRSKSPTQNVVVLHQRAGSSRKAHVGAVEWRALPCRGEIEDTAQVYRDGHLEYRVAINSD